MQPHADTASVVTATTRRPESPISQALARASASTAAARADLIALPNGSSIRAQVQERMERLIKAPVGPALARRMTSQAGAVDWPSARTALRELAAALTEAERGSALSREQLVDLLDQVQTSVVLMLGEVRHG